MRGFAFTLGQAIRALWGTSNNPTVVADRTVNVTNVDGAALGTHAAGHVPGDTRQWAGTALAAPDTAGYPKVTHKNGTGAGEILLTAGKVDVNDKTGFALAAGAAGWSAIKSITYYASSISCAASFSGDKDVALSPAVTLGKTIFIPAQVSGALTGVLAAGIPDNVNLTYQRVELASTTAFRFKTVANADGGSAHNINYAFWIVEFY